MLLKNKSFIAGALTVYLYVALLTSVGLFRTYALTWYSSFSLGVSWPVWKTAGVIAPCSAVVYNLQSHFWIKRYEPGLPDFQSAACK